MFLDFIAGKYAWTDYYEPNNLSCVVGYHKKEGDAMLDVKVDFSKFNFMDFKAELWSKDSDEPIFTLKDNVFGHWAYYLDHFNGQLRIESMERLGFELAIPEVEKPSNSYFGFGSIPWDFIKVVGNGALVRCNLTVDDLFIEIARTEGIPKWHCTGALKGKVFIKESDTIDELLDAIHQSDYGIVNRKLQERERCQSKR